MESHEMIPTDMKKKGKHNDLDAQFDEVADLPEPKKAKTKLKVYKRRTTSTVWHYFQMLPTKDVGYNLKRHLELCRKKFEVPLSILVSTGADIDIGNAFFIYMLAE